MKYLMFFLIFLQLKSDENTKWGYKEENDVVILDKSNFKKFIEEHQRVFVKFCSTKCGHCDRVKKKYSLLAKKMKESENGIPIAKVFLDENEELLEKYEIKGFPSFQLFINKENIEYIGDRDVEGFENFIQQNSSFKLNEVEKKQDIEDMQQEEISVLFLLPKSHHGLLKNYVVLSLHYPNVPFAHSFSDELKEEYKIQKQFAFVVFRKFKEDYKILELDELESMSKFKKFFKKVKFPIISTFNEITAERVFGQQNQALIYLSDTEDKGFDIFREFSNTYKEHDMILVHSGVNHGLGIKLSEYLDVDFDQQGVFRIVAFNDHSFKKYKVDGSSVESLIQSMQKFQNDELKPYYKSQPLPEHEDDKGIKVVVSDNYDDIVCNSDKYVFLQLYAPWCDYSLKLQPIFEKLAEILKNQRDIILAKVDATANEHPALTRRKFPTLQLHKPGKLDSIKYKGDRTLEDILNFLATETNINFEEFKEHDL